MIMWLDRSYTILRPPKRILRLSSFPSATDKRTALSIRSSSEVEIGETVYALGYPGYGYRRAGF